MPMVTVLSGARVNKSNEGLVSIQGKFLIMLRPFKLFVLTIAVLVAVLFWVFVNSIFKSATQDYSVGKYVIFGSYPQFMDVAEPIEWLVLDNDGENALLLSKYCLDARPFHFDKSVKSWHECNLRLWLNNDFYNKAFTEEEHNLIVESTIESLSIGDFVGPLLVMTNDKLFCLSVNEAQRYFGDDIVEHIDILDIDMPVNRSRACVPTAYSIGLGVSTIASDYRFRGALGISSDTREWWCDNCGFWLRSPARDGTNAARVLIFGNVVCGGCNSLDGIDGVRPAMRIKLEQKAGVNKPVKADMPKKSDK